MPQKDLRVPRGPGQYLEIFRAMGTGRVSRLPAGSQRHDQTLADVISCFEWKQGKLSKMKSMRQAAEVF